MSDAVSTASHGSRLSIIPVAAEKISKSIMLMYERYAAVSNTFITLSFSVSGSPLGLSALIMPVRR